MNDDGQGVCAKDKKYKIEVSMLYGLDGEGRNLDKSTGLEELVKYK